MLGGEHTLDALRETFARWPTETIALSEEYGTIPIGYVSSSLRVCTECSTWASTRAARADGFGITEQAMNAGEAVTVVPHEVLE